MFEEGLSKCSVPVGLLGLSLLSPWGSLCVWTVTLHQTRDSLTLALLPRVLLSLLNVSCDGLGCRLMSSRGLIFVKQVPVGPYTQEAPLRLLTRGRAGSRSHHRAQLSRPERGEWQEVRHCLLLSQQQKDARVSLCALVMC